MNGKTNRWIGFVVVALVAIVLIPTASAARAKPTLWCPQKGADPCRVTGDGTRFVPTVIAPKIRPSATRDQHGAETWRSGSWLMY